VVDGYSARALRVLAIAARPMQSLPYDENNEDVTILVGCSLLV